MIPDTFTIENFTLAGLAMLKMLTWFWPVVLAFGVFCVFEHIRESRVSVRVKPDSSEPW